MSHRKLRKIKSWKKRSVAIHSELVRSAFTTGTCVLCNDETWMHHLIAPKKVTST